MSLAEGHGVRSVDMVEPSQARSRQVTLGPLRASSSAIDANHIPALAEGSCDARARSLASSRLGGRCRLRDAGPRSISED